MLAPRLIWGLLGSILFLAFTAFSRREKSPRESFDVSVPATVALSGRGVHALKRTLRLFASAEKHIYLQVVQSIFVLSQHLLSKSLRRLERREFRQCCCSAAKSVVVSVGLGDLSWKFPRQKSELSLLALHFVPSTPLRRRCRCC